ncbi:hypothetical protein PR048_009150 [Dryococelus australis]|uniref:Uncharacterized protein n=1 Tax=Dryococelus australis TaxID=614101 RepID=A0ABQ9HZ43_9NEOP|nr:hypothetical protein PR048_009150 [Dryococelus australis]
MMGANYTRTVLNRLIITDEGLLSPIATAVSRYCSDEPGRQLTTTDAYRAWARCFDTRPLRQGSRTRGGECRASWLLRPGFETSFEVLASPAALLFVGGQRWSTHLPPTRLYDMPADISTRGGSEVSLLASHKGELCSIPGRVTPGFSHLGLVPDHADGQRVFSGISSSPFIPALLHTHLNHLNHPLRLSRPRC